MDGRKEHAEIERKYLIRYPDIAALEAMSGCEVWGIRQTYLTSIRGSMRRVRQIVCNGETRYVFTEKRGLTDMARVEMERELTKEQYEMMLEEADKSRKPLQKVRFRIPNGKQVCEIDVYPFWKKQAVLEIELESEDEEAMIPEWISLIREVTGEEMYSNSALAKHYPAEDE